MFDPADKDTVSVNGVRFSKNPEADKSAPKSVGPYGLMSREEQFRFYLLSSQMVAEAHGVQKCANDQGTLTWKIINLERLKSQDEWKKNIIRSLMGFKAQ